MGQLVTLSIFKPSLAQEASICSAESGSSIPNPRRPVDASKYSTLSVTILLQQNQYSDYLD